MPSGGNRPLTPPLKPRPQAVPQRDGLGKARRGGTTESGQGGGGWRDPAVFADLDERVRREEEEERAKIAKARPAKRPPKRKAQRKARPAAPAESEAFREAKEAVTRAADEILKHWGGGLSKQECGRLANALRSAITPKRKAGRRPTARVTRAYEDWKAGMRGPELYVRHIQGWEKHNRYRRKGEARDLMDAIRKRRKREEGEAGRDGHG